MTTLDEAAHDFLERIFDIEASTDDLFKIVR